MAKRLLRKSECRVCGCKGGMAEVPTPEQLTEIGKEIANFVLKRWNRLCLKHDLDIQALPDSRQ